MTLAGWSHGSSFVNILMISRLARGLYHRALLAAGVQYTKDPALGRVAGGYDTLPVAEADSTAFGDYMGATDSKDHLLGAMWEEYVDGSVGGMTLTRETSSGVRGRLAAAPAGPGTRQAARGTACPVTPGMGLPHAGHVPAAHDLAEAMRDNRADEACPEDDGTTHQRTRGFSWLN